MELVCICSLVYDCVLDDPEYISNNLYDKSFFHELICMDESTGIWLFDVAHISRKHHERNSHNQVLTVIPDESFHVKNISVLWQIISTSIRNHFIYIRLLNNERDKYPFLSTHILVICIFCNNGFDKFRNVWETSLFWSCFVLKYIFSFLHMKISQMLSVKHWWDDHSMFLVTFFNLMMNDH